MEYRHRPHLQAFAKGMSVCSLTVQAAAFRLIATLIYQKSRGVHKILVRKIGFPPPEKGPKMSKNCANRYKIFQIDTFSGGGGGEATLWIKRFYGHMGVSESTPTFCKTNNRFPDLTVESFRGATQPFQPDLPLWPRPSPNTTPQTRFGPDFDLISTWFGPEIRLFRSKSGRNQVRIRSGGRCSERVGVRGAGPSEMALELLGKCRPYCSK